MVVGDKSPTSNAGQVATRVAQVLEVGSRELQVKIFLLVSCLCSKVGRIANGLVATKAQALSVLVVSKDSLAGCALVLEDKYA